MKKQILSNWINIIGAVIGLYLVFLSMAICQLFSSSRGFTFETVFVETLGGRLIYFFDILIQLKFLILFAIIVKTFSMPGFRFYMRNIMIGVSLFLVTGCYFLVERPKIEITSEYIINENWSKKNDVAGGNSIQIIKMKLKRDSVINPFSQLSQPEVLNKLVDDSSFLYYTNVKINNGESYKSKKIYFNADNGFYWGVGNYLNGDSVKMIGTLQRGNWYKFSRLVGYPYFLYIYIDSNNSTHRFDVNLANY